MTNSQHAQSNEVTLARPGNRDTSPHIPRTVIVTWRVATESNFQSQVTYNLHLKAGKPITTHLVRTGSLQNLDMNSYALCDINLLICLTIPLLAKFCINILDLRLSILSKNSDTLLVALKYLVIWLYITL